MREKLPRTTVVRKRPVVRRYRQRLEILGLYYIPAFAEVDSSEAVPQVWEAIAHTQPQFLRLEEYLAHSWDLEPQWLPAVNLLFLSPDGEELVGTYWDPPYGDGPTRFALVFEGDADPSVMLTRNGMLSIGSDAEPIPERLLRLIWLEN